MKKKIYIFIKNGDTPLYYGNLKNLCKANEISYSTVWIGLNNALKNDCDLEHKKYTIQKRYFEKQVS